MPVRHLAGNVVWTRHGTVWALFRVEGEGQAHTSVKARMQRLHALESLVKRLHGESMWLSLCPQVDPVAVVRQMVEGVDLASSPRYEALAERVLDGLEQEELTARTDWLAVPLPASSRREALREVWSAGIGEVSLQLGLMPPPVTVGQERRRLAQAEELMAGWPGSVRVRPASEAEVLWIYGHSARRGVLEPLLPEPDAPRQARGRGRGVAALEQAVLVQGGVEEEDEEDAAEVGRQVPKPFRRRWLQVATPWGSSYQALMALTELPEEFRFPGSEYLSGLDDFPFAVDWVMRLKVIPGSKAEAKTRHQAREVASQEQEYAQDPAGAPASVRRAPGRLAEYRDGLTASASEVEVQAMGAFCVWGATPSEVESRAAEVEAWFESNEYALVRPLGEQERLWYGMLPGAATPSVMVQYRQYFLARDFCMAGPFTSSALGDERGPLFGLQMSGGGVRPVLADFSRGPKKKTSASAAFIGELGSGKSTAMKVAVFMVLAAGRKLRRHMTRGRAVIVDRTHMQEWVKFIRACPGTRQVVTIDSEAQVSLDPLRILTRKHRDGDLPDRGAVQRRTESFLTMLLGVSPQDEASDVLSEVIELVLERPEPSMRALLVEVEQRAAAGDAHCRRLGLRLRKHQRSDLGRVIFDSELPALDATADAVVFSVASLRLPSQRELEQPELLTKLSTEKTFGRAALYLIAAICQRIAFESGDEFTSVVWDECWWLTQSPEGQELLLELLRDGRKHNSGVLVGSHDAHDIGPDTKTGRILRGLIPRRHVFRQTNHDLARRALAFLDLDSADESLVELVTSGLSPLHASEAEQAARAGECLKRDLYGRVGEMRVLIPDDDEVKVAIHSDPEEAELDAEPGELVSA